MCPLGANCDRLHVLSVTIDVNLEVWGLICLTEYLLCGVGTGAVGRALGESFGRPGRGVRRHALDAPVQVPTARGCRRIKPGACDRNALIPAMAGLMARRLASAHRHTLLLTRARTPQSFE